MTDQDGISLSSTPHPVAPWWNRLGMWIAFWRYRDVSKASVEVVEIEIKRG